MKKFQLFILILLSSSITAHACMYYPYGEDVRFCFFRPEYYNYYSYSEFDYSSNSFDSKELYNGSHPSPNEEAWFAYCKGKVPVAAIRQAVYKLRPADFSPESGNEMVRYLFKIKDTEAIRYLQFAKQCEFVNGYEIDPWERNETELFVQRKDLINQSLKLAEASGNSEIKLRYSFLAIRMALYNDDVNLIKHLHESLFANSSKKNIVYYWSLYFNTIANASGGLANFYAAQIFANAPDKRFAIYQNFNKHIPLEQSIEYASNDAEKANVYFLYATIRSDRALSEIKKIYTLDPKNEGLAFLMLREINKIEDWIYTPYYSMYTPSIENNYDVDTTVTFDVILQRVERDRKYAGEVLDFINSIKPDAVSDTSFWLSAKAQLELATRQYTNCLTTIVTAQRTLGGDSMAYKQLNQVKALALTAAQEHGEAIILDAVKPILLDNKANKKFVFAVARELEYKGNTIDAALLYSQLNQDELVTIYMNPELISDSYVVWKNKVNNNTYYDYYDNYFDYLNVYYTPQQVERLISNIENNKQKDTFAKWKYKVLKKDISRLYDLLGVKYVRQNNLIAARDNFKKVANSYWSTKYGLWEKEGYGYNVFDENPFYTLKYTPEFIPDKIDSRINKYTVARDLIKYLERANNTNENNRDYYYFLIANCYKNMTHGGNAWMMRRFNWSSGDVISIVEDEKEYKEGNLAKYYYAEAMRYAKTKKFKALCARMIGGMEEVPDYSLLRDTYPEYYNDLTNNCTAFNDYFKARR
jgi:hypothetical protein